MLKGWKTYGSERLGLLEPGTLESHSGQGCLSHPPVLALGLKPRTMHRPGRGSQKRGQGVLTCCQLGPVQESVESDIQASSCSPQNLLETKVEHLLYMTFEPLGAPQIKSVSSE